MNEIEVIVRVEEKYRDAFIQAICTDYFKAGIDVGIPVIDHDIMTTCQDISQAVGKVESICVHLVKGEGYYFTAKMKILDTVNGRNFASMIICRADNATGIVSDYMERKKRVRITPIMSMRNTDPYEIHRVLGFYLYFDDGGDEK